MTAGCRNTRGQFARCSTSGSRRAVSRRAWTQEGYGGYTPWNPPTHLGFHIKGAVNGTLMGWKTFGPRGGLYTGDTYTVYRFKDDTKFMIGAADLRTLLRDHHLTYVRVNEPGFIDVAFDADHEALMALPGERRLSR